MKKLVVLLLASLVASTAFAGLDTDTDMMGLYFDTQGDVVCKTAAFLNHVPAYILYTNPSIPTTRGFECAISKTVGNSSLTWSFPLPSTNVGVGASLIVGYSVPMPTVPATLMATCDIFFLDFIPVDFFIGPSAPSSNSDGLPMVMLEDFSLKTVGTSVLDGPCAQINAPQCMVVENEDASFGAMKALFR
jgi:hypothetical protein